jgi:lipopolysaccharide transport system ATP-binding protein
MAKIVASNVYVDFPVYGARSRSLKNTVLRAATGGVIARDAGDHVIVRALSGVTFELNDGDRVGLVGHNGSGKSTLLRVLAGAYEPIQGSVMVEGRVASMLNVWLGMDVEATGYENISMRAIIMGFRPREIAPLVDEIVAFSELGEYIDMPMRTYSSGMAMRLAFAISACISADILLMDEWLSIGDAEFSTKAAARLAKLVGKAKILVLASHDETLIRSHCNRLLRLSHGQLSKLEDLHANVSIN